MNFRVLGCSGSESDRNHPCSFLIGTNIVVDMGSAASRLTLEEQCRITDIFLSHGHLDHTKDLAFFSENVFSRIHRPVTVRGTADTLRKMNEHLLNGELWPNFTILPTEKQSILKYESFAVKKPIQAGEIEALAIDVDHPGGCVALFFKSKTGSILYTGDTGPTDEVWEEVNRRGDSLKAILLEASFPNRLKELAKISGHHTPDSLAQEIKKIRSKTVPIFVYHLKAPYKDETKLELNRIEDPRIRLLEAGMVLEF